MKTLVFLFSLFFLSTVLADIRPRHSGAWFNPDQSGHGLNIQVLDNERTIAFWYAYTPDGHPMFLVVDGVHDHHTLTGPAHYQDGMIWGVFDPDTLNQDVWGEVSIEFLDCTRAVLRWVSDWAGYGEGEVALERLASVSGLDCDDVATEMTGEWQVAIANADTSSPADDGPYTVVVNADGTFAFENDGGCHWSGHFHVQDLERGWLTGEFGASGCDQPIPNSFAYGNYYAEGLTFCNSGGGCMTYDQGLVLTIDYDTMFGGVSLQFLR